MQTIQIKQAKQVNVNFEQALDQFLKVEAQVIESLHHIEQKALNKKPLSKAQDLLRQLCARGFLIEDIASQIDVCPSTLHALLGLKCDELPDEDFSSLLLFYCAAQCGYVSPLSAAKTANKRAC